MAMAKAQGEMATAKKDSDNPFFKSKYADLSAVWEACRQALSKNNLSVIQTTGENDKGMFLTTTLCHSSGQWISGIYPIITQKQDPQGMGSAITYARRYALAAMVGVAPADEDDDGERAMNREGKNELKPVSPQKPAQVNPLKEARNLSETVYSPGEHVCTFGKYGPKDGKPGMRIKEIDSYELQSYVNYVLSEAEKKGQKLQNGVLAFVEAADAYLNTKRPLKNHAPGAK